MRIAATYSVIPGRPRSFAVEPGIQTFGGMLDSGFASHRAKPVGSRPGMTWKLKLIKQEN